MQTYCAIFTSPSLAETMNADEDEDDDNPQQQSKRQKTSSQKKATKSNVTTILNMDGRITGRSIAYAAVLVSNYWSPHF